MKSPLGSTKSSNLVARPIAGLSGAARLCRVPFGTLRVSSWANYLEASLEQLDKSTSLKPFSWEPLKFFSFLMANSKGRFQTWIAPVACSFKRFLDWDFVVGSRDFGNPGAQSHARASLGSRSGRETHPGPGSRVGLHFPRRGESQL